MGYINVLYAPYVAAMSYDEMRQEAQHMIFSGSQTAFSRGGQTLFLDFNVHTGVPRYMQGIQAIGPSGKLTGKTYGEYAQVAASFCRALLEVWRDGDSNHRVFAFPKCDFHINDDTFKDPVQLELLKFACQIAAENGVPYFVFDRDEVTLSACCRLRTAIKDNYMLEHLESMRFCGFQNITVNLPQSAYKAGRGNYAGLIKEIHAAMEIACKAHLEKRRFIKLLMSGPQMPLWEIGKAACDGLPYVDLEKATYIIGLVGLNECVQYFTGQELHEGEEAMKMGLRIVAEMNIKAQEFSKRHSLKFSLEESPAESATRRLAKIDLRGFPEAREVLKGSIDEDEYYYTNSCHLRASAPVDMITRIRLQSKFHGMIESGAIIHAFVGERLPSADSIFNLVQKAFYNTLSAQLTISPEFTVCTECHNMFVGSKDECPRCGARNMVERVYRGMDYKTPQPAWNVAALSLLEDRSRRVRAHFSGEVPARNLDQHTVIKKGI